MRIFVRVLVIVAVLGVLSACKPPPPPPAHPVLSPGAAAAAAYYPDTNAAIEYAFGRFGPDSVTCAKNYAARESGFYPASDNGSHHGIYQLHDGWYGSIVTAAQELGRAPDWYDPWVNALAASYGFSTQGWVPWRPALGGCA